MPELPTGTVTFLFTDVEGSTRLLQELGDRYADVLADHRRVLRDAFQRHGGVEVDTQGDAFFAAFARVSDALAAAAAARDALSSGSVRVRMGLHTGEPVVTDEGYVGIDVHRAARIAAAGHGGQILMSRSTRDLASIEGLRDLGEHRLKDLTAPERIYQLGDGVFPPLKSLNNTNLPAPADPLLGRKKELAEVLGLFREGSRLVTITGPGGIGKTRFALGVAAELIDAVPDGVWWIGLAAVRDPKLVSASIAATIGAKEGLESELRGRRILLLLDNFEQVLDAAADLAALQRVCDGVALLVTSREPLHIASEREYPLSPLPEAPAVELLRRRAETVAPDFDAEYHDLVELCNRLDRLPLAIELAAARTKALSVANLLDRLEHRLPLLISRRRDVDERQRTLRATIEWSYDLLPPDEQEVFAALSVFAGSFDPPTAEEVCGTDVDRLESLVDKSLLRRVDDGRLLMFETIREFAADLLAADEDGERVAAAHAHYFLGVAEDAEPHLNGGPEQAAWFALLERDLGNLRRALSYFREQSDAELELRIAAALWEFWWMHGYAAEGRGHLLHAVHRAEIPQTRAGIKVLEGAAYLAYLDRDEADARRWAERLMELAHQIGDDLSLAQAWHMRALLARDDDERVRFETRVLELAGDKPYASHAAESLGLVALRRGNFDAARAYFERVVEINERAQHHGMVAGALVLLAMVAAESGDSDEAVRKLLAGIDAARTIGDETPFVWDRAWMVAALVLAARGSVADALRVLGAAEKVREERRSRLAGFTAAFQERTLLSVRAAASAADAEREWNEGKRRASREYLEEMLRRLD